MQERDRILGILRSNRNELRDRYGVLSIGLFGSVARGDDAPASDVDLAVELDEAHCTLRNFMELEDYLARELGRPVDLGVESSLKPAVREAAARDMVHA